MKWAVLIAVLALAGCAQRAEIASPAAPPPPPPAPKKVWFKAGSSNEEFARTKARCIAQAETASAASPDPMTGAGHWMVIFPSCMRAEGWVLVNEH